MIRIGPRDLSASAATRLKEYQSAIDRENSYEARVRRAQKDFKAHSRNKKFREIKSALASMCFGPRRCMYCEDSVADEIEHHHPKSLYPELTFVWPNYLYSCGSCNGKKLAKFAVFDQSGKAVEVSRKRGAPLLPPLSGDPLLVMPRIEDPLELLILDLRDTFCFEPRAADGSRAHSRARFTIDALALNRRPLLQARCDAYHSYRARVREYGSARNARRHRLIQALGRMPHPTVWQEMRRQHQSIPELAELFSEVPEALRW